MLPPVGDCTSCASTLHDTPVPSLLDRDIRIDRRSAERASEPAFVEAANAPPSVAPLAAPLPPPAAPRAAAPQPGHPGVAAPRMPAPQPGVAAPRAAAPQPPPAAPRAAAPQPGVAAPRAAAPQPPVPPAAPRMAPPQAAQPPAPAAPRVAPPQAPAAPRAAQPPAAGSPMTPAYGTPTAAAQRAPAVPAPSGLPRMEAPAAAPSGLPRMESSVPAPSGLPLMSETPVSAAPSGLPRMESLPPAPAAAATVGISRSEAIRAPAAKSVSATGNPAEVHARPASLWRRLLSFTIDTAAIAGVAALYITLASSVTGTKAPEPGLVGLDAFVAWLRAFHTVLLPGFFLVLVLALVYCAVAAFLWNGRTLGRLLLGLRLVDTHGVAPAPGRAIVRAILASLSFVLFLGGFWMALFDRRGQTLHDKLTSTFVVQPS
ncbi:RDD family protein [Pyxidicoccus sp. MSG2]|uniref:RDD family protein n=1 Tax=Pyxidicoccus sp. MSG2 TaxID=2996790 RepID=UPI0022714A46|nr:RDD family protein [Pyxidicoccus sp. MSG2]MCY1016720.1 RDD family protein [Pyxidicoccus sp. MSG2]